MTDEDLDELLEHCPVLYHMAEKGSWPSIQKRGLLSTSALLDLYGIDAETRESIESTRRPESVTLSAPGLPPSVVRDQKPMTDAGLIRALPHEITPRDWYETLNSKVFFWLTRPRLIRLLTAGPYRDQVHDVLEVSARPLVEAYRSKIWLCPINSGCTKPMPHPRGSDTFRRIADYPYQDWRGRRVRGERVVELCVDYAVPDISKFVVRAVRMRGETELGEI